MGLKEDDQHIRELRRPYRERVAASVGGNLVPDEDRVRALGSSEKRWLELNVDATNTRTILVKRAPVTILPDKPGYLPPTPFTSYLERGYQYVSNIETNDGCEAFYLSGDGNTVFSNVVWPLTIILNFSKAKITRYRIGAGLVSQAPQDWTVPFLTKRISRFRLTKNILKRLPLTIVGVCCNHLN